jgi:PAS domain S-box-containing protein
MPPRETAWLAWQALDQSDDVILLLENDGAAGDAVVIAANGAFHRASGYSHEQIVGRQALTLFSIPDQAERLRKAIRDRTSLQTELTCGRADGGTFVLGLHLMPAPERTSGRACFTVLGRDITVLLEARQMQNSIQRLLAKVFMSVDEAVAIANAADRIVMTNPRIDRLLGHKPNELVGRSSLDMVAPDSRASTAETIRKQLELGTDQTYLTRLVKADGSQIDASITSVLVATEDNKQFRILTLRSQETATVGIRTESAGRIKLVGLDEVRLAMGGRWHAVAERAMATAEAVIKRRCGKDDSYSRADETSFLMCFGSLGEQEASFRAAMIGREIHDRLIGQGSDPDTAYVRSIAASVRFPDHGEAAASLHALLLNGLDAQLGRLESEARHTLQTAVSGASCDLMRITGRNAGDTIAMQANLPGDLERRVIAALAALPVVESKAFDLDGLLLGLAAQQAISGMARGDATPMLVNVRFDVFATRPATERYFATCLRIDQRVTGRLILLLSALPEGLPRTRQLECVNRLRPYCQAVGYHVAELANLAAIDLSFSGNPIVSLPARALADVDPEKLRLLLSSLHARRAKVLVRGVASAKDAAWFRLLGADMIAIGASQA